MEESPHLGRGSTLDSLPEELIIYIIGFLDSGVPSAAYKDQPPRIEQLFRSSVPLKTLSAVSRQFRRILRPLLFRHLRICVNRVVDFLEESDEVNESAEPPKLSSPLLSRFARRHGWHGAVSSITLYHQDASQEIQRASCRRTTQPHLLDWAAFVAELNPVRVTVIAPPQILAQLLQRDLWMDDAWAFKISLQRVDLVKDSNRVSVSLPALVEKTETWPHKDTANSNVDSPSFLDGSQWRSFHYHGGSCLPSFGTYHYFLKVPPCLITASDELASLQDLGRNLVHFSYATMFPHFHHFHRVLRNIACNMPHLETLVMQLAPSPASEVWCNLELIGRGNLNLRDCWAEIERSYRSLVELLDILSITEQPVFQNLVSVTILDCRIKTLNAELSEMISKKTSRWVKKDQLTLERVKPDVASS